MNQGRRYAIWLAAAWLGSFCYLLLVYYPTVSIHFAHHDQYRYFLPTGPQAAAQKMVRSSDPQWGWLKLIGRPVAAELEHQVFKRANTLSDLAAVRIFGIGLYALAMAVLVCFLLELKLTPCVALCLAGAVFALPGVQFSVYMASLNHPVAQILALGSALLMRLGSRLSAGDHRWYLNGRRIACHLVAISLLVIAQLSYVPSAFVVLFPIAAEVAVKGIAGWPVTRRHLLRDASLLAVSCVVYYVIARHYYLAKGGHQTFGYQVELNRDFVGRFHDFLRDVPWPTLNLWNVYVSRPLGIAVGCCLASSLVSLGLTVVRRRGRVTLKQPEQDGTEGRRPAIAIWRWRLFGRLGRVAQLIGAIGFVLLLSETTYFATCDQWTLYRTHCASAGIVVLLLAGAAVLWGRLIPAGWRGKAAMTVGCAALCGASFVAHHNVLMNCLNDSIEFSYVCAQISAHADQPIRRVHLIQPPSDIKLAFNGKELVRGGDEFNIPTTWLGGSLPYIISTALQTVFDRDSLSAGYPQHTSESIGGVDDHTIAVTFSGPQEPVVWSPDMLVIDMEVLYRVVSPAKRSWRPPTPPTAATAASSPPDRATH